MDTLTEGCMGKLFNVILCNLVIHGYSDRGVHGVFTSFVTWSSMDTLTEGAWGVHILCNLVIHGYSDRGVYGAVQCYPL